MCIAESEAFDRAIVLEQRQNTIQRFDGKLHLSTSMVQKLADASLSREALPSLYEKLNVNGLYGVMALAPTAKSICHHKSNSAWEFSPEYPYISNIQQSESQKMTFFQECVKSQNDANPSSERTLFSSLRASID